jgi:hypothetical protein
VRVDAMMDALREILGNDSINFFCTVVGNDVKMLEYYGIASIQGASDLQMMIPNPTTNYISSFFVCSVKPLQWDRECEEGSYFHQM